MLTAQDELKVLYNAIAQAGGIDKVDLHAELAKAHAMTNTMATQEHMANMQRNAQLPQNNAISGTLGGQPGQTPPQDPNASNMPQNGLSNGLSQTNQEPTQNG